MRSLINRDLVRQNKAIAYAPHGARAALVEAQQIRSGRLLFDDENDVIEKPPESARNSPQGPLHHSIEFGRRQVNHPISFSQERSVLFSSSVQRLLSRSRSVQASTATESDIGVEKMWRQKAGGA
jgi:hypothetical protein